MTREQLFEQWAPQGGPWSPWVKPVLFAHMPAEWLNHPPHWFSPLNELPQLASLGRAAVVVDLPGEASADLAVKLAEQGFRPVPLFNGTPELEHVGASSAEFLLANSRASINVWPIMRTLSASGRRIAATPLPADAPPAFLLDAHRRISQRPPMPGTFDNRWITFPTDFPSARLLIEHAINRVLVISGDAPPPATDLAHTLRRWQEGGIEIVHWQLGGDFSPRAITIERPGLFRKAWYQFTAALRLRRNVLGGFGGEYPDASSG